MKKKLLSIILIGLALVMGLSACTFGEVKKPTSSDKKQIVISIYNGGHGTEWMDGAIAEFEKDYPEYEIQPERRKRTVAEIEDLIAIGTQADAYISGVADFHREIYRGNLEDLSDILDMKVDGTDMTIGGKMNDLELWKKVASKDGEGLYMLPYDESVLGFNYDHEKFVEYGLMIEAQNTAQVKADLTEQGITYEVEENDYKAEESLKLIFKSSTGRTNYNDGDIILRAGKDGKYGTYDDGQPITMAEWNNMFNVLKGIGKAVIYSGQVLDYTTDIFNAVFAQYDGLNAWDTFMSYEGSYTFEGNSQPTTITLNDGYKVFGMTGIKKATEFLYTYLNNTEYAHESCFMSEESHTDAQGKFVIGSAKTSATSPFTGLLVDGVWWENEARKVFTDLSSGTRPNNDYKYGERDYRIMLLPQLDGQKGIDGEGNGSVLSARSTGSVIVPKNLDADILEKTKIFISYTLKDTSLRSFTVKSGSVRPYNYTLTEEDRAQMTSYALNAYDIYNDKANIGIVRPLLDRYVTAVPYKTSKGFNVNWMSKIGAVSYNMPISALRIAATSIDSSISSNPVNSVFLGFYRHSEPAWAGYMAELGR